MLSLNLGQISIFIDLRRWKPWEIETYSKSGIYVPSTLRCTLMDGISIVEYIIMKVSGNNNTKFGT